MILIFVRHQSFWMLDNQSAMAPAKNPVNQQRSKHINVKYHRDKMCCNPCQLFVTLIHSQMNLLSNICFTTPTHIQPGCLQQEAISN